MQLFHHYEPYNDIMNLEFIFTHRYQSYFTCSRFKWLKVISGLFFCKSEVLQLTTLLDAHDLYTISIGAWFPLNESIRLWSVVGRLMSSSFRFIWAVNLNLTANTDCSLMIKRKINFRDNIAFVALVFRLQCCQLYLLVKMAKLMKE